MPSDDGLKEFLTRVTLSESLPIKQAGQVRQWLSELQAARDKIAAMEHGLRYYIDRNVQLAEAEQDWKRAVECWVTRAGMLEAKLREAEETNRQIAIDLGNMTATAASCAETVAELETRLGQSVDDVLTAENRACELDELLWWITAEAERRDENWRYATRKAWGIRQMLTTQGYTREALEKK